MSAAARTPARRPAVAVAIAVALVAAVVVALVTSNRTAGAGDLRVAYDQDTRVLDFSGSAFDGSAVDTQALRGTPMVLNFYASWCTVCDRELPDFQRVADRLEGRVTVLGANPQSNDTDRAQAQMIERAQVQYPTFADPTDELLRQFTLTGGLPVTVFLDGDGVVQRVHNGLLTEDLLLQDIEDFLGVTA